MNKARKLIVSAALVAGIMATSVTAFASQCPTPYASTFCGPSASCPTTFSLSNALTSGNTTAQFIPINVISSEKLSSSSEVSEIVENVLPVAQTTAQKATAKEVTPKLKEEAKPEQTPAKKAKETTEEKETAPSQNTTCSQGEDCQDPQNCLGSDCETANGDCSTNSAASCNQNVKYENLEEFLNNCIRDNGQSGNRNSTCPTDSSSCGNQGTDCQSPEDCLNGSDCEGNDCQTAGSSCPTYGPSCDSSQVSSIGNIDFSSLLSQNGSCNGGFGNFGGFGSSCGR